MMKKLWQNMMLVILIAAGIAVLWGFFAAWGIERYERRTRQQLGYETLVVDAKGKAWIQVHNYSRSYLATPLEFPYRTLDGQPTEVPEQIISLSECPLSTHSKATTDETIDWPGRVNRVLETDRERWFLVHNGKQVEGRAYLVGYDQITNFIVGYCGRQGFRSELPAEKDWFLIEGRAVGFSQGGYVVKSSRKNPKISFATQEGWFEFDVRQRAFRVIEDAEAYLSVSICKIPEPLPFEEETQLNAQEEKNSQQSPKIFSLDWPEVFAARQQDRIVVQPVDQEQPFEFVIPEEYRDRHIDFYFVSADQALLETSQGRYAHYESLLVWINAKGKVQKAEPIQWKRYQGSSGRESFAVVTLAMPIPIAITTVFASIIPFQQHVPDYSNWQEADYLQRLGLLVSDGWPALLGLVIVSLVLTWIAMRWHRRYSRSHLGVWATLVFLLGLPGFLGYWAYHRRPALENCPECGKSVPRSRDTCASCKQSFSEPRLLGTEVFA